MTYKDISDRFTTALGLTEAPVAVYYTDEKPEEASEWCPASGDRHFCHIGWMKSVRAGKPAVVSGEAPGCMGAGRSLGFQGEMREGFEYFLSQDSEGHGERYKKTPEIVRELLKTWNHIPAGGKYCVFQRLDQVPDDIDIEGAVFFERADQIAGLIWLAHYDRADAEAVIAPFAAGCGSMVYEMRKQAQKEKQSVVLGMFDPSARPRVAKDLLTISIPKKRLLEMYENIPGSFLEIQPWLSIKDR
jgi:uncharacterized protein (DUF169 family)